MEQELIEKYDSIVNGYNIQSGGDDVGIWARNNLGIRVYQLDTTDCHIIKEYNSISDAAREYNTSTTAISQAIKRKGICQDYYWCFTDDYSIDWFPNTKLNEKSIYKIDKRTFKIIEKYDSITIASKENHISYSGLRRCEEFFSLGGYCWCKCDKWYEGWKPNRKANTSIPVFQIEQRTLIIINEWPSIVEASKVLKINKTRIGSCCRRESITAGGYHWCFVENYSNWKPKRKKKTGIIGKIIVQLDLNDKEIKTWNSILEASKSVKVSASCISNVCAGRLKSAGGYKWKYK